MVLYYKIFPKGSYHQRLPQLIVLQQIPDFLFTKQMHGKILRGIEMLVAYLFYIQGKKTVCQIIGGAGISRNIHQGKPSSGPVACFFEQFPLGSLKRCFVGFAHSGAEFVACFSEAMPVLAHQDELARAGYAMVFTQSGYSRI